MMKGITVGKVGDHPQQQSKDPKPRFSEGQFSPWRVRVEDGFWAGGEEAVRLLCGELVFFDGSTLLARGCQYRDASNFGGAVRGKWVALAEDVPPFSRDDLEGSTKITTPPYSQIHTIRREPGGGKWAGYDKKGTFLMHLTGKGASDIFRCRNHWELRSAG